MIFNIFLYLLLSILTLFLLFILIPINYQFTASKYEILRFQGKVSFLWGVLQLSYHNSPSQIIIKPLGIPISVDTTKVDVSHKKEGRTKKKNQKHFSNSKDQLKLLFKEINKELFILILNTIEKIFHSIAPKVLIIKAKYGFDDPYHNAILLALVNSLYPLLKGYNISLVPSFNDPVLEGEFEVQGQIVIILLMFIVVKLMLTKPIRKVIKILRKNEEEKAYVH